MKRMILALAAFISLSSAVMAQDTCNRKKRLTREEMVKERTERTVKQYGLDAAQAAKLLVLNTEFADKQCAMGARKGSHGCEAKQSCGQCDKHTDKHCAGKPDRKACKQKRQEMRKEYGRELKKILTKEQFEKFTAHRKGIGNSRTKRPKATCCSGND